MFDKHNNARRSGFKRRRGKRSIGTVRSIINTLSPPFHCNYNVASVNYGYVDGQTSTIAGQQLNQAVYSQKIIGVNDNIPITNFTSASYGNNTGLTVYKNWAGLSRTQLIQFISNMDKSFSIYTPFSNAVDRPSGLNVGTGAGVNGGSNKLARPLKTIIQGYTAIHKLTNTTSTPCRVKAMYYRTKFPNTNDLLVDFSNDISSRIPLQNTITPARVFATFVIQTAGVIGSAAITDLTSGVMTVTSIDDGAAITAGSRLSNDNGNTWQLAITGQRTGVPGQEGTYVVTSLQSSTPTSYINTQWQVQEVDLDYQRLTSNIGEINISTPALNSEDNTLSPGVVFDNFQSKYYANHNGKIWVPGKDCMRVNYFNRIFKVKDVIIQPGASYEFEYSLNGFTYNPEMAAMALRKSVLGEDLADNICEFQPLWGGGIVFGCCNVIEVSASNATADAPGNLLLPVSLHHQYTVNMSGRVPIGQQTKNSYSFGNLYSLGSHSSYKHINPESDRGEAAAFF